MSTFLYRDGARLTPYMLHQVERLNAKLKRQFGVEVRVTSGIRLRQEQIDIFLERYVTAANVRGRRIYDTKTWRGVRYFRISSAGTVAVPGSSFHEIQGRNAALDLRDTGPGPGIATMGSARSNWLRANCGTCDMDPEGFRFGEAWHFRIHNVFEDVAGAPLGGPAPTRKGIAVKRYHREDATARKRGRRLVPGSSFWLNTVDKAKTSQATNVVGGVGEYAITLHVYAQGAAGDAVVVQLYWDDTKTSGPHSAHYSERITFGADGVINRSVTFQRGVEAGFAVYANCRTPGENKGDVRLSLYDSDALLFA
jgi:hypothetical protein